MKFILVGDLHFRAKKLQDIQNAWTKLVGTAIDKKVDAIIQAGDIFDHCNIHSKEGEVGTIYDAFISPLKNAKIPFITITGNHDIGAAREKDALFTIDKYDFVTVKRKPEVFNIAFGNESLSICALPWIYKDHYVKKAEWSGIGHNDAIKKVESYFDTLFEKLSIKVKEEKERGAFVLCLGHLEITGAKMANGMPQSGGLYEFSSTKLSSLETHAYALGHIHKKQYINPLPNENDGYLGTLCQLRFDECGSNVGFRYLEIKGQKILEDVWVENTVSPRYFQVETLEGLSYRKGFDYVNLIGDNRPESLPEGVTFKKKVKINEEKREQNNELLNSDTPLETLLSKWKESSKNDQSLDSLVEEAKSLASQIQVQSDSIGSLEQINFINLKNVTCHKDSKINLDLLKGLCGIEGENGSGKTTAIESILVGLYGISPSRPYLPSLVSMGCQEPAIIEIGFKSQGKDYKVKREIKLTTKGMTHKALLYEVGQTDEFVIAGPKVEEVNNACSLLIGDPTLVLAGVFSSQGEAGNMLDLRPAERKELFAKLLGTDKFLIMGEVAKKKASGLNTDIESVKSRIERLKIDLADDKKIESELVSIDENIKGISEKISSLKDKIEAVDSEIKDIDSHNKNRVDLLSKIDKLKTKRNSIIDNGKSLKRKLDELKKIDIDVLKNKINDFDKFKKELDSIILKAREMQAIKEKSLKDIAEKKQLIQTMLAEKSAKYAEHIQIINKEESLRKDELNKRLVKANEILTNLKVTLSSLDGKLKEYNKKAEFISGFPNKDICKTCPLAKDGIEGARLIPDVSKEIKDINDKIEKIKSKMQEIEIESEKAKKTITPENEFEKDKLEQIKKLELEVSDMFKKSEDLGPTVEMKNRATELKKSFENEEDIRSQFEQAKTVEIEASKIETQIISLKSQIKDIDTEISEILIPETKEKNALCILKEELSKENNYLSSEHNKLLTQKGRLEALSDENKKRYKEMKEISDSISCKEKSANILNALAIAFGRDGIPQLIVDTTIPHFQEIMESLMVDFEGRWEIQVLSQKTNKSGNVQEVIDIVVNDGDGDRDISTYSGGERKILKSIIRIAFSSLQAERSGKGLKILVLDEATDSMDDEISENFIKMLKKLEQTFNQTFVVSHNDRILTTLPNRIRFERKPGHSTTVKGIN